MDTLSTLPHNEQPITSYDECLGAFTDAQFRLDAAEEVLANDGLSPIRGLDASSLLRSQTTRSLAVLLAHQWLPAMMDAYNSTMSVMRSMVEANKRSQQALLWLLDQQRFAEEPPAKRKRSANGVKQVRDTAIEVSLFSIRSCGFMLLNIEHVSRAFIIIFGFLLGCETATKGAPSIRGPASWRKISGLNQRPTGASK